MLLVRFETRAKFEAVAMQPNAGLHESNINQACVWTANDCSSNQFI